MDPIAALRKAQGAITSVSESADRGDDPQEVLDLIEEAQESLGGLSEWIRKGGFLPATAGVA